MLVIRRRAGEAVVIEDPSGNRIELQVMDVSTARVKLGFAAPASVLILRKEILLASEQNRAAARGVTPSSISFVLEHLRSKTT